MQNSSPPSDHTPDGTEDSFSVSFEDKYTWIKIVGMGGEGRVDCFGTRGSSGGRSTVAVKTLHKQSGGSNHLSEVDMIRSIPKHSGICEILEVYERPLRIVMPLYADDLFELLSHFVNNSVKIPEAFTFSVFTQLAQALQHIHHHGVCHRDVKVENCAVEFTPGQLFPTIKLIDFGMATRVMKPHFYHGGTPKWQCGNPEAPFCFSPLSEVSCLGSIIHCLVTRGASPKGEMPGSTRCESHFWYTRAKIDMIQRIVDSNHSGFSDSLFTHAEASKATFDHPTPLPNRGYSPLLEYWMLRALEVKPEARATTTELTTVMAADADKQINFYKKWIPMSGKCPLLGFAYPEPPAGWVPEK